MFLAILSSFLLVISKIPQLMSSPIIKEERLPASTPFVHAPTILETSSGQLLVAWYGGTREGSKDDVIYLSKQVEDGDTPRLAWCNPLEVASGKEVGIDHACWNPVLFQMPSGTILLFYKIGKHPSQWQGFLKRSYDDGKTWGLPEALPEGIVGPSKNKPLLIDGHLLCGSSRESRDSRTLWMDITKDEGYHWEAIGPLLPIDAWAIQPTLLQHPDGQIYLFCRSKTQFIYAAHTLDDISNWSPLVPTSLPSNNSGIDAIGLSHGEIFLLAFNDIYFSINTRNWLRFALSFDKGKTWEKGMTIEWSMDPFAEFSYPAMIQSRKDGHIHLVYTWKKEKIKYVVLDPASLLETRENKELSGYK